MAVVRVLEGEGTSAPPPEQTSNINLDLLSRLSANGDTDVYKD